MVASALLGCLLAQETEGLSSCLTKTPDGISERPPQLAAFLFALMLRCVSR